MGRRATIKRSKIFCLFRFVFLLSIDSAKTSPSTTAAQVDQVRAWRYWRTEILLDIEVDPGGLQASLEIQGSLKGYD